MTANIWDILYVGAGPSILIDAETPGIKILIDHPPPLNLKTK